MSDKIKDDGVVTTKTKIKTKTSPPGAPAASTKDNKPTTASSSTPNMAKGSKTTDGNKGGFEGAWSKVHPHLLAVYQHFFQPAGHNLTPSSKPVREPESAEYEAYQFAINNHEVRFRVAKVTPTKNGQFVTLWKRDSGKGPIKPFDLADKVQAFVISVHGPDGSGIGGQFVFPSKELATRGILSKGGKGGKRAMRVYPPWVRTESKQASNTQDWQVRHFLRTSSGSGSDKVVDPVKVRRLFASLLK